MNILLLTFLFAVAINLVLFVPAYIYKTDKLTDISYSASFVIVAAASFYASSRSHGQLIGLLLVLIWAARLGGYLFQRIQTMKRDKRFDGIRENFWAFGRFWLYQGITVFVVLLASILFWWQQSTKLTVLSWLGVAVYALGLLLETTADIQKYRFKQTKQAQPWIDSGVWGISRHPNYLGEILVWLGIYLFVAPSLPGADRWVALASPLFITGVLCFVSGIPPLERSASKRWGKRLAYQSYKQRVPLLVPTPKSLRRLRS